MGRLTSRWERGRRIVTQLVGSKTKTRTYAHRWCYYKVDWVKGQQQLRRSSGRQGPEDGELYSPRSQEKAAGRRVHVNRALRGGQSSDKFGGRILQDRGTGNQSTGEAERKMVLGNPGMCSTCDLARQVMQGTTRQFPTPPKQTYIVTILLSCLDFITVSTWGPCRTLVSFQPMWSFKRIN